MKFKKGDQVLVTAGKDKGKKGNIEKVLSAASAVVVPGVNLYKRHVKKRSDSQPGTMVEHARPLPVANVALVCPKCGKQTRIGYLVVKGQKERICKKCEQKV